MSIYIPVVNKALLTQYRLFHNSVHIEKLSETQMWMTDRAGCFKVTGNGLLLVYNNLFSLSSFQYISV